jgi:tetratricopeptide (TPR) repeat protein
VRFALNRLTLLGSRRAGALVGALLSLLVLTARTPLAHADPAQARKHFEMGRRYVQVDEYRKAIEEFKAAHVLEPDPAFLYNIAECYRRLGENDDALKFYRRFLSLAPAGNPQRALAATRVEELEKAGVKTAPAVAERPVAVAAPPAPTAAPVPLPAAVPPAEERTARAAPARAVTLASDRAVGDEKTADSAPDPFYRRGWFYGVVGAVLVGGALGVWALSSRGGTEIPGSDLGNQTVFRNQ